MGPESARFSEAFWHWQEEPLGGNCLALAFACTELLPGAGTRLGRNGDAVACCS